MRLKVVMPWLWGVLLSAAVVRFFFRCGPGEMPLTHEGDSYVYRVIEFLSCLRAGYAFPEWAVDFRGGLGSPHFGYYQPGFFYAASIFAAWMRTQPALGMTVAAFSFLGYAGMLLLVRERFGTAAGLLAATTLLLSPYSMTDLYVRGDLSEYCGMMILPALLHGATAWIERGRRIHCLLLTVGCGVLIVMHPAAALLGYGVLGLTILCYAVGTRFTRRAIAALAALVVGGGLATFFWLPVVLEWNLVQGDRAATGPYAFFIHFIDPRTLVGFSGLNVPGMPLRFGAVVLSLIGAASVLLIVRRRSVNGAQWRLVAVLWLVVGLAAFMMASMSGPVWDLLPLLQRIQFPWRFMLVLTVAAAALSGCTPACARSLAVLGIAAQLWTASGMSSGGWEYGTSPVLHRYPVLETPADLARDFVKAEAVDEWLPRDAKPFGPSDAPREPRCETAECRVDRFEREPGRLRVQVTTPHPGLLTLPHYFFPVGWKATMDGVRLQLVRTDDGLMRVPVPAGGGIVEVTFTTTPTRRLAECLSGFTLAGVLVMAAVTTFRERH